MICMLLRLKVKPGKMDELQELLDWDARHARENEPETLRFDVLPGDAPQTMLLYEAYASSEAFEFHQAQPPFKKFVSEVQPNCVESIDVLAGGVEPMSSNAVAHR